MNVGFIFVWPRPSRYAFLKKTIRPAEARRWDYNLSEAQEREIADYVQQHQNEIAESALRRDIPFDSLAIIGRELLQVDENGSGREDRGRGYADGTARRWHNNGQLMSEKLSDGTLRWWRGDGSLYSELGKTPHDAAAAKEAYDRGMKRAEELRQSEPRNDESNDIRFSLSAMPKYAGYRKQLHEIASLARSEMLNKTVRVGDCPTVLTIIGFENRPLYISGSVIWKSMFNPQKKRYISEKTLGKIGEAIETPLFIEKSATIDKDAILVHTELEHKGKCLAVVIHMSKKNDGYLIHNIASVYSRSQSQKDRVLKEGRLLYLDTQKGLKEFSGSWASITSPPNLKDLFVDGIVRTEKDLRQAQNAENPRFSKADTAEAENPYAEVAEERRGARRAYMNVANTLAQKAKVAALDCFGGLEALERVMNGGELLDARKAHGRWR